MIRVDAESGTLDALIPDELWLARDFAHAPLEARGMGRELFGLFRGAADEAELPSGDAIAAELTRYLRERENGDDGGDVARGPSS